MPVVFRIPLLLVTLACSSAARAQTPSSGLAAVNESELYYEVAGSGHPLVLIHGGGVDRRLWDGQFQAFAARYKVIRYDLRGSGKSQVPLKRYSNAEDLYGLLRFLKVDKTYLLGLSRGGGVAFDFTLAHPEMVAGLILVSSNLSNMPAVYREMISSAAKAGREEGISRAAQIWGEDPYQGPGPENVVARQKARALLEDNLAKFLYFWGGPIELRPGPPAAQRLSEINTPTLVIYGERDAPAARANYENWAKGIRGAKKIVLQRAAHLVNMDRPDEFNRAVLEFLDKLK